MKNLLILTGLVMAFVVAIFLTGTTSVSAQDVVVPAPVPGTGQGYGQTGVRGGGLGVMAVDEAVMHEALAGALGMSVADYEAAIANGETLATLALAQGVDMADLFAVMDAVHADAAQQAVADGLVTQEQADWVQGRRGGQAGQGGRGRMGQGGQSGQVGQGGQAGTGSMMRGGQRGAGGNAGVCLYPTVP
jgi:hypothetical protein